MDSSVRDLWTAAEGSPFVPAIAKQNHFVVSAVLLLLGLSLSGVFALKPSALNLPLVGVPASLTFAVGVVYMFCAVGVYV
jgi:hypothetical protein